jgi:hypothetical protein
MTFSHKASGLSNQGRSNVPALRILLKVTVAFVAANPVSLCMCLPHSIILKDSSNVCEFSLGLVFLKGTKKEW